MKKYFFTGLLTLLPLAVTFWIVHFFINFLTKPFFGTVSLLTNHLPIGPFAIRIITQLSILITLFLLILFLGLVARRFFFGKMLQIGDRMLIRIPLVNKVYKTSKEIVKSLFSSQVGSFKQVVMIQFPYTGCYCIGLIARNAPKTCSDAEGDELVSVYIPTTPNPTTGFLVMSKRSELILLDMKNEEAIKYIVSCGVVQPAERGQQ